MIFLSLAAATFLMLWSGLLLRRPVLVLGGLGGLGELWTQAVIAAGLL